MNHSLGPLVDGDNLSAFVQPIILCTHLYDMLTRNMTSGVDSNNNFSTYCETIRHRDVFLRLLDLANDG